MICLKNVFAFRCICVCVRVHVCALNKLLHYLRIILFYSIKHDFLKSSLWQHSVSLVRVKVPQQSMCIEVLLCAGLVHFNRFYVITLIFSGLCTEISEILVSLIFSQFLFLIY